MRKNPSQFKAQSYYDRYAGYIIEFLLGFGMIKDGSGKDGTSFKMVLGMVGQFSTMMDKFLESMVNLDTGVQTLFSKT